ncbi:MCE family protein [Streptomyces meridianus]|uniref:MCE family protein n=1 Tax=Streptomyces meridianus TaxID=2938945 RepID=A0ABT0X728_9ACTN|nr:MlaD family protein [Streptomyces meridianus]MCM2578331.1 MCE family protein [Streptomyces meridianus]
MITRTVKSQLLAFGIVTVLGVSYVGAEYAGLADRVFDDSYTVRADFAESGGIFPGAEVTYRGVPVGRVGDLHLQRNGVGVELDLEDDPSVPADTLAVVANRSAIGEQYVDLQPRSDDGPYLEDGSTIERGDTRTPLPSTDLVLGLDRLVNSVDRKDLRVTVDELGKAFAGSGRDLSRLVDSGNALVDTADDSLPQTVELIEDSRTVLKTQQDKGSAIKSFSRDLADLTDTLKGSDADIRKLIDNGDPAAHQLDSLLKENRKALPVLLGNLISGGQITTARLPNLEQVLVTFPAVVAGSYTVQPGDGTTHFGMVVNADDPPACKRGYGTRWRDPSDTSERRANTSARCAEPRGSKTSVRGAQNAPRPSGEQGAGGADRASYVAPYDEETGAVRGPDGQVVRIGTTGGQQSAFGKDSWQWLLVGPMA